ncbi:MAG: hypothetical protein RIQ47_1814 [Bacteroidota bacterium]|jgi:uncharacterized metal-binding protein YceD (DUF177 family)
MKKLVPLCPLKITGLNTMGRSRDYVVEFGALPLGEHEFEFEVDDTFFQQFENSILQHGKIDVLVVLEKKSNMLLLDFTLQGEVTVTCDRCLDNMTLEMEGYTELIVKLGDHSEEEAEDVIMIPATEHQLDLAQYIYECISVMVPMRNVHPDDDEGNSTCNPEIIREIEKHQHSEAPGEIDPRWEMLKKINLN